MRKAGMTDALKQLRRLAGSQARVAEALGLTARQVSRIATGECPEPVYMKAVAELLEALPPKDWPQRWNVAEKTPAKSSKRR